MAAETITPIFTVSARGKRSWQPILPYLRDSFGALPIEQIESVFGFVDPCTLYGGRPCWFRQISDRDTQVMAQNKIGVRIPITTHYVTRKEYEQNRWVLEKHHRDGNSLIVQNDMLVPWLRQDFPYYRLEASMLKFLNTYAKIEAALTMYDTVVLPMNMVEDPGFLKGVRDKDRVTLFGNAGCALTCPARTCYAHVSRVNKLCGSRNPLARICGLVAAVLTIECSQKKVRRQMRGMVDFEIQPLIDIGFRRFKMLRSRPLGKTSY